jgi:hypothetical protein
MLPTPNCFDRGCRHFLGVYTPRPGNEAGQMPNCKAFPKGIPREIAYGPNEHLTPMPDQGNDIVFEKGPMEDV